MESKPDNTGTIAKDVRGLDEDEIKEIRALTVQDYSYLETLTGFIGGHRMNFGKSEPRLTRDRKGLMLNSKGSIQHAEFHYRQ